MDPAQAIANALGNALGPIVQNAVAQLSKTLPTEIAAGVRELLNGAKITVEISFPEDV